MQYVFYMIGICGFVIGILGFVLGNLPERQEVNVFGEIVLAIVVLVGVTALGFGALLGRLRRLENHLVNLKRWDEHVDRAW